MTKKLTQNQQMLQRIVDLLERLVRASDAEEILAEKRATKARQQARYRASRPRVVSTEQNVDTTKEKEGEKREIPPTPPIESKGEEKEQQRQAQDARAREADLARRVRNRRIWDVMNYNLKLHGNIDAAYFVDYYADKWPNNWKARFRNWLKQPKVTGRLSASEVEAAEPVQYAASDWALCQERCAHFKDGQCSCGIHTPPDHDPTRPHPPNECPKYRPL